MKGSVIGSPFHRYEPAYLTYLVLYVVAIAFFTGMYLEILDAPQIAAGDRLLGFQGGTVFPLAKRRANHIPHPYRRAPHASEASCLVAGLFKVERNDEKYNCYYTEIGQSPF